MSEYIHPVSGCLTAWLCVPVNSVTQAKLSSGEAEESGGREHVYRGPLRSIWAKTVGGSGGHVCRHFPPPSSFIVPPPLSFFLYLLLRIYSVIFWYTILTQNRGVDNIYMFIYVCICCSLKIHHRRFGDSLFLCCICMWMYVAPGHLQASQQHSSLKIHYRRFGDSLCLCCRCM